MSQSPEPPAESGPTVEPTVEPTVVVGYPGYAAPVAVPSPAGRLERLSRQVRLLQVLVVGCVALLVLLALGLGAALAGGKSQLDALSEQISALSVQPAAGESAKQATGVAQLGSAPILTGLDSLPGGADEAGAILIGNPDASNVVEVYVDYQCPYCQRWESTTGATLIDTALKPGSDLLVKQYNLAFLGEQNAQLTPAGASARAASAAACVIDADGQQAFADFSSAVFAAADPSEPPGQFTAAQLSELAQRSGASAGVADCIEQERFVPFVSAATQAGFGRGVGGTPTVVVNGRTIANPFEDPALSLIVSAG